MTKRSIVICTGIVAVVVLFVALIVSVTAVARPTSPPHPPSIAGQNAPANVIAIDFDKRYHLHCSLLGNQLTVFRNCKIIGFTREEGQSNADGFSVGPSSSYRPYFRAWLVLEQEDGRRAYLPPDALRFMEESPGKN